MSLRGNCAAALIEINEVGTVIVGLVITAAGFSWIVSAMGDVFECSCELVCSDTIKVL